MGPFIAYFPTYLKFHELFRLGAYCHPFDLIDELYRRDQETHSDYTVKGDSWDTAFGDLKTFEDGPFAFLSPAMQEGSALAGPFLPIDCTLHEVHHYMGLGSIWGIGLPGMPATVCNDEGMAHFGLFAYPDHWTSELPYALGQPRQRQSIFASANPPPALASGMTTMTYSDMPDLWLSVSSGLNRKSLAGILSGNATTIPICHIGVKLGESLINPSPGWTSHLPGKDGLLCQGGHVHVISNFTITPNSIASDEAWFAEKACSLLNSKFLTSWDTVVSFGRPIELPDVLSSPPSIHWHDIALRANSFESRTRASMPGTHSEVDATSSKDQSPEENNKDLVRNTKALQNDNEVLEKEVRLLKEKLESRPVADLTAMKAKIDELQVTADQRLEEIGVLTAELGRVVPLGLSTGRSAAISVGQLDNQHLREQLDDAKMQLSLSSARNKALEEQTMKLKQSLDHARGVHVEAQNVTQSIDTLKKEEASLKKSVEEEANKISQIEKEIQDLSYRHYDSQLVDQLQSELQRTQFVVTENVELRDKLEVLEGEFADTPSESEASDGLDFKDTGEELLNKFNEMSRSSLKRKVEQDFFHGSGSNKKMRPSTEVNHSSLDDLSLRGISQYTSIASNEVLRIAGTGGLINPMHFDVTKTGAIALTKLGLERATLFSTFKSQPNLIRSWTKKKATEMSNKVRKLMDKGGFFLCGHLALLELKKGLQNGGELDPGSLVDALNEMSAQTFQMREKLVEYIAEFKTGLDAEWTEENTMKLKPFLIFLYAKYDDRQLGLNTKFLLADMRIGAPRERMLQHIQHIANSYHRLVCVSEDVRIESRIPGHYLVPTAPWESVAGDGDEDFRIE